MRARLLTPRVGQVIHSLGASAALQASLFASGVLLARGLIPADRGTIAIVLALPPIAAQVTAFGLPSALTYFVARDREAWWTTAGHVWPLAATQTLLALAVLGILNFLFLGTEEGGAKTAATVAGVGIPFLMLFYYGLATLQGLGDIHRFNYFRVAQPTLFSLALLTALISGLSLTICAVMWVGSMAVSSLTMAWLISVQPRRPAAQSTLGEPSVWVARGRIARFAAVGFPAQVSPVETFRLDLLVVAALFPPEVVGYYAVAVSVSNVPRFVADALAAVAYPQVAAGTFEQSKALAMHFVRLAAVLCGSSAVVIALSLPFVVPLLFGTDYEISISIANFLLLAAALMSVRRVGSDCLRALGRPGTSTVIELVGLLVLAMALVLLGPFRGGQGVAISLSIAGAFGLAAVLWRLRLASPAIGANE